MVEDAELPRGVGLPHARLADDPADAEGSIVQRLDQAQTGGFGENRKQLGDLLQLGFPQGRDGFFILLDNHMIT